MSQLHDECGVAAIYHLPDPGISPLCPEGDPAQITRLMPRMLLDIQNRGQLAAGMTIFNPRGNQLLDTHREVGSVTEVFRLNHRGKYESLMRRYAGIAAIGHVRYATCGSDDRSYAQPFERRHFKRHKWFSFAFNGQLANYRELRTEILANSDNHLSRETDTEIIMHSISAGLAREPRRTLVDIFREVAGQFDGAYSLVFLDALGNMVVVRDPLGIKPLSYAMEGPLFAAASESVALLNLGFASDSIKSLLPGQMVTIIDGRFEVQRFAPSPRRAHCFFEWVYFSNVASTLDGRSVYMARKALGEELARLETLPIDDDTIVVPVPDTSKAAADAMAYKLGVPCLEGLIRNRYSGRTFIEGSQDRQAGPDQVHAAARGLGGKAGAAGGGLDRPLHDDEGPLAADQGCGPAQGDPRARGLPPDHLAVLLRHRHVHGPRAYCPAVPQRRPTDATDRGPNGRPTGRHLAPLLARGLGGPGDRAGRRPALPGVHHGDLSDAVRPGIGPRGDGKLPRRGLGADLRLRRPVAARRRQRQRPPTRGQRHSFRSPIGGRAIDAISLFLFPRSVWEHALGRSASARRCAKTRCWAVRTRSVGDCVPTRSVGTSSEASRPILTCRDISI